MTKKTSAEVRQKHKEFLFPSVGNYYDEPVVLDEGKGLRVKDLDGTEYLDFFGGILTVSIGQAHPRVNAAVKAQIDRLGHVSTLYPTVRIVELAEKLVKLAPGKIAKAFFSASGTEADETAVALAQMAREIKSSSRSGTATPGARCSRSRSRRTASTGSSRRRSPRSNTRTRRTATGAPTA